MARAIMMQGTASNAGKSLLAAGLCRIFAQDGFRVAPFKSQNMALNSFVTRDGLEMGRAQVMQAECAGVEPDVRMNPILLKPTGEQGSQVIVEGEVLGDMSARDYYAFKPELRGRVQAAYDALAADFDIVVLEGAGSPAEINLKRDDFVNMGMARMARAPVLLVGDIDRGGVFAALAGTHLLFEPWERKLLRGMVINKFRGDADILRPGLRPLEELVGRPVLGVVPWLELDVEDEDSLSGRLSSRGVAGALVDIAVIRLPHISNFTDFDALSRLSGAGVGLRYVDRADRLGSPDLLILPGTKSTMADLRWLRANGLAEAVRQRAGRGGPVFGICGGYQMLGGRLSDPHGAEGGGEAQGLGLLPAVTDFGGRKVRRQVTGRFAAVSGVFSALEGLPLAGYELHMGQTVPTGEAATAGGADPLCELETADGQRHRDGMARGNVAGSYVHGLFDEPRIAAALAGALAARRGIELRLAPELGREQHKQRQYDLLADALRTALDMEQIYRILEEGVSL